uniref:oligosaccharide flippase family protein n=1 Tax=Sphingomonas bacterium TaxID=1895847 RepID=UPI001C2CFB93
MPRPRAAKGGEVTDAVDGRPSDLEGGALGGRAMNGAIVLAMAQGVKFATQLVSTIVLARLLSPHDFGIFAMVMPLAGIVMLFQDLGLAQAVESVREVTPAQATTLFAINLGLSVALAAAFAASAPLIAVFYGTREVIAPTLVLAGTIVLSGLATLQFALLVRGLRFGALAVADSVGAVAGVTAAIIVAAVHPSPWAMIASVVVTMTAGLGCG